MTLDEILEMSPYLEGYEEQPVQMAYYSSNCCWWTSFPEDLGKLPPIKFVDGKVLPNPGGHQIPCCPHCHSVLLQAPLRSFVDYAKEQPSNYGKFGLETFTVSHERNSKTCFREWKRYSLFIDPFGNRKK